MIPATFGVSQTNSVNRATWTGPGNVVDASTANFATASLNAFSITNGFASATLRVQDNSSSNVYSAGTFAGFVVNGTNTITIRTYLNGALQDSATGAALQSSAVTAVPGATETGFYTTRPFNQIEIAIAGATLASTYNVYYASLRGYCAGPALSCNSATPLFYPTYPVTINYANTAVSGVGVATISNPENATDNNAATYATISSAVGVAGSATLAVRDRATVYTAGTFAGFDIENVSTLGVGVISYVSVATYLNGVQQEVQSGQSGLATVPLLSSTGHQTLGFVTALPFNEVRVTMTQTLGISLGNTRIYNVVLQRFCAGPSLAGNVPTSLTMPNFPVFINNAHTGVTGTASSATISNTANIVDSSTSNFAQISFTAGVLSTATIAVKDQITDYPAGYFAGFDIINSGTLTASLLGNITLTTYLNGTLEETRAGSSGIVSAQLLGSSGRQRLGFVTTLPFDEIQLSVAQPVGLSLGTTDVYNAVIEQFAAGPQLACNTPTSLTTPAYPVYIDNANTGFTGVLGVNNNIVNPDQIIDNNPATFGQITIAAGGVTSGSVAIRDAVTTYAAGSYAGYDLENTSLLGAGLISGVTITTYLNGTLRESVTGNNLLISAPTSLLTGTSRQTVGFVSTLSFDEVQLTINQTGLNLGTTNVYGVVAGRYCNGTIGCNSAYFLNNPAYPAVIDVQRTGVNGAACVSCAVNNPGSVITADTTDYARIITTTGVAASGSVAVKDALTVYPAGIIAGFAIRDNNNLVQLSLLSDLTITTYLNGVQQESATGANLLNLRLLTPIIGQAPGNYNVGFVTTLPFNEVQLSVQPVAGVAPVVDVFGAFVDTRLLGPNAGFCARTPLAAADHSATPVGIALTSTVAANDRDPQGAALTYNTTPATSPAHGTVTINANGTYTYTPAAGYSGLDSFQYTVCNTASQCSSAWAYISVVQPRSNGGPNNAPIAQSDLSETLAGRPVSGAAGNNDVDPDGNTLLYSVVAPPAHGGFTMNADGTYTYTPEAGFTGTDTVRIQVCDNGAPALCSSSVIIASVSPDPNGSANDAPLAQDDVAATPAGVSTNGNVLRNDGDPNGDVLTATLVGSGTRPGGTIVLNSNGTYTFYPADGFAGTFSVSYRVCDGATVSLCDTAMLSIAVQAAPPLAEVDYIATQLNTAATGSLRTNDRDPANGTLAYNAVPAIAPVNGNISINSAGDYIYTPNTGFIGADSFVYTVCNSYGVCSQTWAYVGVLQPRIANGANTPPMAMNDMSQTLANIPVSGNARNNDLDADGNSLNYATAVQPRHGTLVLNPNGAYIYTPAAGFTGTDTAMLQVCDNGTPALCRTSMLAVEVNADQNGTGNDRPFAEDDVTNTPVGASVTGNVLSNDSDPNGDVLTASVIGTVPASVGTLILNSNGNYTFYPATGYTGTAVIPYRTCDGTGLCDSATLSIVVQRLIAPDLTPIITSRGTMNVGQSRDAAITIYNAGSTATTDVIQFAVLKLDPQFSISVQPNTTAVTVVGSVAVKNNNWTITDNGNYYLFTLKQTDPDTGLPLNIPSGGIMRVGITVTATGISRSTGILNVNIYGNTGGSEGPTTNNNAAFIYSIN